MTWTIIDKILEAKANNYCPFNPGFCQRLSWLKESVSGIQELDLKRLMNLDSQDTNRLSPLLQRKGNEDLEERMYQRQACDSKS